MIKREDIIAQLKEMGARQNVPTIFHSSLKLIGEVEGGGAGLLNILIEYFTAEGGLLVVPTHTWANLKLDTYTLDMTKCESNLGTFAILALESGLGVRSENPTHSVVVFGDRERALDFIKNEARVRTATSAEGCYGKLYYEGGQVLLAGVMQNKNTYLHAVAEILGLKRRVGETPVKTTVKRENGEVIFRDIILFNEDFIGDASLRFTKYELAFRYRGDIRDGTLGKAPAQLCSARGMLETVKLIFERAAGLDPLADEQPIPPAWFY